MDNEKVPFFFPLSRFSITMLAMIKKKMFLIPAGVLVGLALLAIMVHRPVTIVVDGKGRRSFERMIPARGPGKKEDP